MNGRLMAVTLGILGMFTLLFAEGTMIAKTPHPDSALRARPSAHRFPRYYTVKKGDSWWGIAVRFHIPEDEFIVINTRQPNSLSSPPPLTPGEKLLLP